MTEDIKAAVETLKKGGVILYPTDTIWGLGCDATNEDAVRKIFRIKERQDEKSMLVLLDDENKLAGYVAEIPEIAWSILEVTEKPITIIYPGAQNLAAGLVAEDGSIGIRIVKDDFCRQMIRKFRQAGGFHLCQYKRASPGPKTFAKSGKIYLNLRITLFNTNRTISRQANLRE